MYCSETATYIGSGTEIKGNNVEDKRIQMRTDRMAYLVNCLSNDMRDKLDQVL